MVFYILLSVVLIDVSSSCLFRIHFREYGELLVGCGLIGEAVKTFEDLELWDNLIFCYRYDDTYWLWKNRILLFHFYFSPFVAKWSLI